MKKDWTFRSAGVLIRGEKILVRRETDGNGFTLPDAYIELGETSKQALIREYAEETGADISCGRLLCIEESPCGTNENGKNEIIFYYMIEQDGDDIPCEGGFSAQKNGSCAFYEWLPLDSLEEVDIHPSFLSEELHRLVKHPICFVSGRRLSCS